ncbi:Chromosome (plasmid) partitioning protein ParB / Stage 0 sporulation protein J [Streptococcus sp. DD10]|nr:Chromosome (plasmid) partitioning protein ParB / Stage 0 sporulation protein J [Streptococcus sp. DD10]
MTELAESIKQNGLIQPIIVRKSTILGYELLAGERRLRASRLAGLQLIPAIVKELTDQEMMLQSIIENLQRDNLNPIEEAKSYQTLVNRGMTHEELAKSIGKSRPYISNSLRLLQLSLSIQQSVINQTISQAHARLLVSFSPKEQEEWLQRILHEELSVRRLEELTKSKKKRKKLF